MTPIKTVLFDADGVMILPPKMFSQLYCEEFGVDIEKLVPFYKSADFKAAMRGELDLKEAITRHQDKWQWRGNMQELLDRWFAAENYPNQELVALVKKLQAAGTPVYLATTQERHRAKYLRQVMFPNTFDGAFISCDIGFEKSQPEYWKHVLKELTARTPGLKPEEIIFFDDSPAHLSPAHQAGVRAVLYESPRQVATVLQLP